MTTLLNVYNRLFCVVLTVLLFFTGVLNHAFNGDVEPWVSSTGVVGLEALTRSQGVTNDGECWIFSGKNALERVDMKTNEVTAVNPSAIPDELAERFNAQHIGGISYANGYIYAGVEDSKSWQHPLVVLYDAKTLAYTGKYYEMPKELCVRGIPWVIADADNGVLYTASSKKIENIYVFDLDTMTYQREIVLAEPVDDIQGGEYADGLLYVGTNDATRAVYTIAVDNGLVTKLFDRIAYQPKLIDNMGGEGEDLTLFRAGDGTYIHTLQIGAGFTDATLRHYAENEINPFRDL